MQVSGSAPKTAGLGRRELKKRATRAALSSAAIRLAIERGFDNVLVEDIASAAGVSPRTFNNYFSSKAEAVSARQIDRAVAMADALRARPPEESLWEALTAAVLDEFDHEENWPDKQWMTGLKVMMTEPTLQVEMLRAVAVAEQSLADAVADRTGTDVQTDVYPRLVAATVSSALGAATTLWVWGDGEGPLGPLVREALETLANGLADPEVA
ncbi:acyl-CoA-like ligand-binding transcription factor [Amycolatopsis sp. CA-230715]|uniref:acyl-CoA-like ligand-binding transcription factor n=1 Tax=Amycolatopsis sp. CA-230715 TaxID=2745196 RepID=UPI001C010698|nr:TetR family transcriptional regulator [Amycolatopsis sp. CA-230715]QWF85023.1 Putative mycofactocin biosynthesis transcriptional regulator MftR [Amycolatopsis sp. CA-230715]